MKNVWIAVGALMAFASQLAFDTPATMCSSHRATSAASAGTTNLPLRFEANEGQWDSRVRFVAHQGATTLFITDDAMVVSPRSSAAPLTLRLAGGRAHAPVGEMKLVTRTNYFIGNDPTRWRTNVSNYARVRARQWRPGVDVVWHEGDGGMEYDLEVAAGVDARAVVMEVEGALSARIAPNGVLELEMVAGTFVQKPPHVVQAGRDLRARYAMLDATHFHFELEGYLADDAVLIDPALSYSTYLGGTGVNDQATAIAVDSTNATYVAGWATSTDFPTTKNAYQPVDKDGLRCAFISKLDAHGTALVYSTYLGGSGDDIAKAIAVDASGDAYVTGVSYSSDFPMVNPYQSTRAGLEDVFVAKLSSTGSALVYSTYLGGTGTDMGQGIAVDSNGRAYVAGSTRSAAFPTSNALQGTFGGGTDAFVTALDASGSTLAYSTFLGGSNFDQANAIAVDASGAALVTGSTNSTDFPTKNAIQTSGGAFVTKLDASGANLSYSTRLGGSTLDYGYGIALEPSGSVYVTGVTSSTDFPTTTGAYQTKLNGINDVFVTRINAAGSALVYSTYLGGSNSDQGTAIAVDANGRASVIGGTGSTDFPLQSPVQSTVSTMLVSTLDPTGSALVFSTYLGGSSMNLPAAIAVDGAGSIYVTGGTQSKDYPLQSPFQGVEAGGVNAFITRINLQISTALSLAPATVAPNASHTFVATGGSGAYAYSLVADASGGAITSTTGTYTAGSVANVVDVVQVVDSDGDVATAKVTVIDPIAISPTAATTTPFGSVSFSASGGSGAPYTWSLATNDSGGSVHASNGQYMAGALGGVVDVVQVKDSLGNTATASVTVSGGHDAGVDSGADANDGGTGPSSGGAGCGCIVVETARARCDIHALIAIAMALLCARRRRGTR